MHIIKLIYKKIKECYNLHLSFFLWRILSVCIQFSEKEKNIIKLRYDLLICFFFVVLTILWNEFVIKTNIFNSEKKKIVEYKFRINVMSVNFILVYHWQIDSKILYLFIFFIKDLLVLWLLFVSINISLLKRYFFALKYKIAFLKIMVSKTLIERCCG